MIIQQDVIQTAQSSIAPGSKLLGFQIFRTPKNCDRNPNFWAGFPNGNPEIAWEIQNLRQVFQTEIQLLIVISSPVAFTQYHRLVQFSSVHRAVSLISKESPSIVGWLSATISLGLGFFKFRHYFLDFLQSGFKCGGVFSKELFLCDFCWVIGV